MVLCAALRGNGLSPLMGRAAKSHYKGQAYYAVREAGPIYFTWHPGFLGYRGNLSLARPDLISCPRNK